MNRVVSLLPRRCPRPMPHRVTHASIAFVVGLLLCFMPQAVADDNAERFFESEIRPILVEHCIACHGATEQNGGLRLDSKQALLKGGQSGSAAVAGSADSLILKAVTRSGDLAMPPDEPLTEVQVAALRKWVELGLPWPDSSTQLRSAASEAAENHWAFQPVEDPPIPAIPANSFAKNPIDAFVLQRLHEAGLSPSPEADRRTLIRRLSYSLTDLPPTATDVEPRCDRQ